jgi:hypothetical protein
MERYSGGCQCGAVRFEADLSLENPIACNCSRCQKLGSLLVFAPLADFRLLSGEDVLRKYIFNTGKIEHLFCETCGIESFARGQAPDGKKMVAVNVNCLDGVEPRALNFTLHDGRAH